MLKRICPICDQTMGLSNYCKTCHQFVHPVVEDRRYYLNESHPMDEKACDFHHPEEGRMSGTSISAAQLMRNSKRAEHQAEKSLMPGGAAQSGRGTWPGIGGTMGRGGMQEIGSLFDKKPGTGQSTSGKNTKKTKGNPAQLYVILIVLFYILMKLFLEWS